MGAMQFNESAPKEGIFVPQCQFQKAYFHSVTTTNNNTKSKGVRLGLGVGVGVGMGLCLWCWDGFGEGSVGFFFRFHFISSPPPNECPPPLGRWLMVSQPNGSTRRPESIQKGFGDLQGLMGRGGSGQSIRVSIRVFRTWTQN